MAARDLGFVETVQGRSFESVLEQTVEALKAVGFGILTDIDVKATMKAKLGVEFPNYRLLGACNPKLAHRALSEEPLVGLMLPCSVAVFETPTGEVTVAIANPRELFKLVEAPTLAFLAEEAGKLLQEAAERL
jgi:uncharacterized protein (DUF302 family)